MNKSTMTNKNYVQMYLDWVNNFLTLDNFASWYHIDNKTAFKIIKRGKSIYNKAAETGTLSELKNLLQTND